MPRGNTKGRADGGDRDVVSERGKSTPSKGDGIMGSRQITLTITPGDLAGVGLLIENVNEIGFS
jgi:hypothetical protein